MILFSAILIVVQLFFMMVTYVEYQKYRDSKKRFDESIDEMQAFINRQTPRSFSVVQGEKK
jgi:hypothetical protein